MSMKGKPNLEGLNDFLEGGEADKAESSTPKVKKATISEPPKQTKIYKEQKLYRLSSDVTEALRDKAFEMTKMEGRRVTETELVETAIRRYLDI